MQSLSKAAINLYPAQQTKNSGGRLVGRNLVSGLRPYPHAARRARGTAQALLICASLCRSTKTQGGPRARAACSGRRAHSSCFWAMAKFCSPTVMGQWRLPGNPFGLCSLCAQEYTVVRCAARASAGKRPGQPRTAASACDKTSLGTVYPSQQVASQRGVDRIIITTEQLAVKMRGGAWGTRLLLGIVNLANTISGRFEHPHLGCSWDG